MRATLTIETGEGTPRVFHLRQDRLISLGRSRENAIVLRDEHASRRHAEVCYEGGRWVVRDVDTGNGTRLNGKPIQKEAELDHEDAIQIGNTSLRFHVEGREANQAPEPAPDMPAPDPTKP